MNSDKFLKFTIRNTKGWRKRSRVKKYIRELQKGLHNLPDECYKQMGAVAADIITEMPTQSFVSALVSNYQELDKSYVKFKA